jgi:hypothetical protein
MVVICKKATIKLVKGLPYQVVALENSKKDRIGRVWIKDIGWYTVNNFETTDGKPLPKIDIAYKREYIEDYQKEIFLFVKVIVIKLWLKVVCIR